MLHFFRMWGERSGDSYLQQVSHNQVYHEHHGFLSFFHVGSQHPERQQISQQSEHQDKAVHHSVHNVLVFTEFLAAPAALVSGVHLRQVSTVDQAHM